MTGKIIFGVAGLAAGLLIATLYFRRNYSMCPKSQKSLDDALAGLTKEEMIQLLKDMGGFTAEMAEKSAAELKTILKGIIEKK